MTRALSRIAMVLAIGLPGVASAAVDGWWKSVDDETGNIRSIVHVEVVNGKAKGTIVQLFRQPDEIPDPLCTACAAPLNTRKIVGLEIMSGLTPDGATWSGGSILDPASGSVYSVFIEELDGGKQLKVRGYMGFSLLGRTQTWYRTAAPDASIRTYLMNKAGKPLPYVYADGHMTDTPALEAHIGGPLPPRTP